MKTYVSITLALFFLFGASEARRFPNKYDYQVVASRTITVDQHGRGDFTSVQQAIDSVPLYNNAWIRIHINHGTYVEKVEVPMNKSYIILEGDPNKFTVIEYGSDAGDVVKSPTFKLYADNFVARNIVFENTYNRHPLPTKGHGKKVTQAPAVALYGDKASFYSCSFLSVQDTLADIQGRHYFYGCYIEGRVDFIWGFGQSIYERCRIHSLGSGYITAQGRSDEKDPTGFVFKDCYITGTADQTLLGRAYRQYARVLFVTTYMEDVIMPKGWDSGWNSDDYLIAFSEVDCKGPGAHSSDRVPWEKKLSAEEVNYFTNTASFINQEGWLEKQPK